MTKPLSRGFVFAPASALQLYAAPACALAVIIGFIVFAPIYAPFFTPNLYDNARLLQLAALAGLALLLTASGSCREQILRLLGALPVPAKLCLGSSAVFALLSASSSALPHFAFQELALVTLLFIAGTLIASLLDWNRRLLDLSFIAAFCASALLFSVIFHVAYLAAVHEQIAFRWVTPFVSFANVRFFSQYQSYTLALVILPLLVLNLPVRWRIAAFIVAAHWWSLQIAVGTRAVWFAYSIAALVLIFLLRREAGAWLRWQFAALMGGAALYVVLSTFIFSISGAPGVADVARRGFDSSERFDLWQAAVNMIQESPWLGSGPMHYSFRNFDIAAHPHNSWLQLAAEYGLPVALLATLLASFLAIRAIQWCKQREAYDRDLNVALFASLIAGLADSMVSGNTLMPHSQIALCTVAGWLIGRNLGEIKIAAASGRAFSISFLVVLWAAAAVICWGAVNYYVAGRPSGFEVPEDSHPRYWQNGHWPVR